MLRFIAIEGIDGAGLSTQAAKLKDWLTGMGRKAILTKEPTNGLIGGIIRACINKELALTPTTLQLLYAADRMQHLQTEIEPAIKSGKIVVTDRYALSGLAYGSLDIPLDYLKQLNMPFRKPDITIILDVHPRVALERLGKSRMHAELFENEQKLTQVRERYNSLQKYFPETHVVDANKTVEEIALNIQRIITRMI